MANIKTQPKKSGPFIISLIVIITLIVIAVLYMRNRNNQPITAEAASDSTTVESMINTNWSGVDPHAPVAEYEELTDKDITIRGNDRYAVYSISESVLFDLETTVVKPDAEQKLKEIISSGEKRFPNGYIRIYGYTDASGSQGYNKKLAEDRAEAVKIWIIKNFEISDDRISLNPVGESDPVASNDTENGRKQNRRVEIAIRK